MKNIKKFTLGAIGATLLVTGLWACSNDEISNTEQENNSDVANKIGESIYKMNIDNGLDGDILYFPSAELYDITEDFLYDQTHSYINSVMETVSVDWSDEAQNEYLDNISFDEDKIYKDFENTYNFSSLRQSINIPYDQWLSEQTTLPDDENNEDDPDNHPLVLEEQSTLFTKGVEIKNFDTNILKNINIGKLRKINQILSLIEGNPNYSIILNNSSDLTGCASGFVHKKYNHSSTGRQVKSITKETGMPFSSFRQLVAKTVGFRYSKKRGYYRVSLWLVTGITGAKNSPDVDSPIRRFCADQPEYMYAKAETAKVRKFTRRIKNNVYNNYGIVVYDNATYSYHGQGGFVFTKDFHPPHERYVIQNQ